VAADGKSVTYTPNAAADALAAGVTRTDTFTYSVSDGKGGTGTSTVSLTVTGANDAPTALDDEVTDPIGEYDGATVIDVLGNDRDPDDGDTLTVTAVSAGSLGDVALTDGVITYKPNAGSYRLGAGESETDTFSYTVSDGKGGTGTATVTVTVVGVNDGTVVQTGQTPVDVAFSPGWDRGYITNADDDTLTWIEADAEGTGWAVGGTIDVGDSPWRVAVGVDKAWVINDEDDTLSVVDLYANTEVDRIGIGDATDVAIDRTSLQYGFLDRVYTVDSAGTVSAIDTETNTVVGTVRITEFATFEMVSTSAAAPARSAPSLVVAPGGEKLYAASGGRISVVQSTRRVAAMQLRSAGDETALAAESDELAVVDRLEVDGEITALAVSQDGTRLYATVVKDGTAELVAYDTTGERLARVDSVAVGRDPRRIALSDSGARAYVLSEADRTLSVVDTRRLAVAEVVDTGAAAGVAVVPGRDAVLVTNPDANVVSVLSGASVNPTVINADTARTGEDNSVIINVLANDTLAEGATLTPTIVSGPRNGTATVVDGTISYTPNANFSGTDSFAYTVTGGSTDPAPANVTVTVTPAITTTLSWDDDPRDLDAHLIGPSVTGSGPDFHVFYASSTYNVDGSTGDIAERAVFLNADDTDGAGPEVIEINTRTPGEYLYYVHKFSGNESLAQSHATVTVVDTGSGISQTFAVDPGSSGNYWSVFKLTVSATGAVTVTPLNTYGDTVPTLPQGGSALTL
jgi:VCBS repeat-containing protein